MFTQKEIMYEKHYYSWQWISRCHYLLSTTTEPMIETTVESTFSLRNCFAKFLGFNFNQRGSSPKPVTFSINVTKVTRLFTLDSTLMEHCSIKSNADRFPNGRSSTFHHFYFIYGFINTKGDYFGLWKPLPVENVKECG